MKFRIFYVIIVLIVFGCSTKKLPAKKISQAEIPSPKFTLKNNSLEIQLTNPVNCPTRFEIESNDSNLKKALKELGIIELKAKSDTIVRIRNISEFDININLVGKKINGNLMEISLPYMNQILVYLLNTFI